MTALWMTRITKGFLLFVFAILSSPSATRADSPTAKEWWPTDAARLARLCFARPESNGRVNGLITEVGIDDSGPTVALGGGDSACLFVPAGTIGFRVTSNDPYGFLADQHHCTSKKIRLDLAPHQTRAFSIHPAQNDSGYLCGWVVQLWLPNPLRKLP